MICNMKSEYPVTIWCDNRPTRDCTLKDGYHKLKNSDKHTNKIIKVLEERDRTGEARRKVCKLHGDYIKQSVKLKKIHFR